MKYARRKNFFDQCNEQLDLGISLRRIAVIVVFAAAMIVLAWAETLGGHHKHPGAHGGYLHATATGSP